MTRDEIIGIALKVGFPDWWLHPPEPERQDGEVLAMLGRFAALVAAHEREQCAKVCSDRAMLCEREAQRLIENEEHDEVNAVRAMAWNVSVCAAVIRARKDTP